MSVAVGSSQQKLDTRNIWQRLVRKQSRDPSSDNTFILLFCIRMLLLTFFPGRKEEEQKAGFKSSWMVFIFLHAVESFKLNANSVVNINTGSVFVWAVSCNGSVTRGLRIASSRFSHIETRVCVFSPHSWNIRPPLPQQSLCCPAFSLSVLCVTAVVFCADGKCWPRVYEKLSRARRQLAQIPRVTEVFNSWPCPFSTAPAFSETCH